LGTGYDQLTVSDSLTLNLGAQISPSFGYVPALGTVYTVVNNNSALPVTGTFSSAGNELVEGETFTAGPATLTLSYQGGDGNDVTLTVTGSAPFGFGTWIGGFGLDPADQDETDNPDGDSMNNLLEYFSATDPSTASPPMATALDATSTTLRFVFRRSTFIPDLTYSFEWSDDLSTWTPPDLQHVFSETRVGGDATHDLIRATLTYPASAQRRYARVRVVPH
jgi:hypothetical protein